MKNQGKYKGKRRLDIKVKYNSYQHIKNEECYNWPQSTMWKHAQL